MRAIKFKDFKTNKTIKAYLKDCLIKLIIALCMFFISIILCLIHKDDMPNLVASLSILALLFVVVLFGVYSDIKGLAWYCKDLEDRFYKDKNLNTKGEHYETRKMG